MKNLEIGKQIKDARIKKGMNRSDLAKELGYTVASISHWENGIREPNITVFLKIVKILDLKIKSKSKE